MKFNAKKKRERHSERNEEERAHSRGVGVGLGVQQQTEGDSSHGWIGGENYKERQAKKVCNDGRMGLIVFREAEQSREEQSKSKRRM